MTKAHPSPGLGLRWDSTTHKNSQKSRKRHRVQPALCRFCWEEYEIKGDEGYGLIYTKETGELHDCPGYYKGRRCTTDLMRESIDRELKIEEI